MREGKTGMKMRTMRTGGETIMVMSMIIWKVMICEVNGNDLVAVARLLLQYAASGLELELS